METTLRKFKHAAFLSEETMAYTTDIYIDGRKVGSAQNDGQGGATCIYYTDADAIRLLAEAAAEADCDGYEEGYFIDVLAERQNHVNWAKRNNRTKVLFCLPEDKGTGQIKHFKVGKGVDRYDVVKFCGKKYPNAIICDTVGVDQFVSFFTTTG